ncbi:MAG TPA: EscU/YscU/HrcU family type III secretion system export apparatus switch protein [Alphaproteobacteria bacterium]|nr:EscU/YscU/HrcU family type III secretion system export apparatus switch protein [Alphaproteobacteria bacterium]
MAQRGTPGGKAPGARTNGPEGRVAVALDYDAPKDAAPRVVAKGRGEVAQRIIDLARQNGIAVRQDADLAELLAALELDQEIPVEAFTAVAEILSYIYRANGRLGEVQGGPGQKE